MAELDLLPREGDEHHQSKMNIIKPACREVLYKLGEGYQPSQKKCSKSQPKMVFNFGAAKVLCTKRFFVLADFIGILKNHALQQEEFHHLSSKKSRV